MLQVGDKPNGHITVNDHLETDISGVYALGDVKESPAFTHISYGYYRILKANLLDRAPPLRGLDIKIRLLPYVCFTDPKLAHVGLHLSEARAKFSSKKIKVANMPMSYIARALEVNGSRGMMNAVVDEESEQILGFSGIDIEIREVTVVMHMAMTGGLSRRRLESAIFAHPTLSEGLNNLWGVLEDV